MTDVTGSLRGFEEPELIIMDITHKGGPGGEDAAILLVKWRIFRVRGTMNEVLLQSGTGWSSRDVRRGSPSCSSTSRPTGPWIHGCSHARLVQLGSLFRFFNHRSLPCSSDGMWGYYPQLCVIGSLGFFLLDLPTVYPALYGGKCGWRSGSVCAGSAVPGLSADSAVVPVPAKCNGQLSDQR